MRRRLQAAALGLSCLLPLPAAAQFVPPSLTINATPIIGGTTGRLLFDNAGTTGELILGSNLSIAGSTLNAAGSGTVSSGLINQLAYYAAAGTTLSGLATANNGVLVTGAGGVPAVSSTLPSGLTIPGFQPTTLTSAHLLIGSAGNVATDVAMSGDCSITNAGATTCLKTNGSAFGAFATGTDAANLTGTIAAARLTGASYSFTTPVLGVATGTSLALGGGSAITSSGAGGALGSNAFNSTAIPALANPTATVGAAAVNGSASTAMRSDAAPPIGANAVTNALAAQMANSTVKCRTTAGTGNPEDCTAAQAASIVNAGTPFGQPYFTVYMGANQTVTSTVATNVNFDSVGLDSGSYWSASNHNYKPLVAGTYMFCWNLVATGTFTLGNDFNLSIYKNAGPQFSYTTFAPTLVGGDVAAGACQLQTMNGSTDTASMNVVITAGSPAVVGAASAPSWFSGYRIGS